MRGQKRYKDLKLGQMFLLIDSEDGKLFDDKEVCVKTKPNILCYASLNSMSMWGEGFCITTRGGTIAGHFDPDCLVLPIP